jgi:hypothetical protein
MMTPLRYLPVQLLAASLLTTAALQAAKPAETAIVAQGLMPLAEAEWDYANARHLLWRAGFGGTPQEVARLHAMGVDKAVDSLVDYQGTKYDYPLMDFLG